MNTENLVTESDRLNADNLVPLLRAKIASVGDAPIPEEQRAAALAQQG
ncbi:MAG: hypothetical protein HY908_02135 [Myxococcales bacterium]|nr:hypothetical protein [Myxococcales bacterium]